ncbi:Fe-S cluster assembly protein SufD [Flavobacteriales bacterium]|nr:Fe-S cluster assembly protein SufD [Flavobacteriales bacterium]
MEEAVTKKNRFLSNLTAGNSVHSDAALKELEHLEFPNRKTEDWRYTRVASLINKHLRESAVLPETENFNIPQLQSYKIVFSNGNLIRNDVANNNRVTIKNLETSDLLLNSQASLDEIFTTINTAFTHGGVYIHLDKNTILDKPIEIIHLIDGQNTFAQIRKLIVLEQGAEAQIVEGYYASEKGLSFTNAVSEIIVKNNAKLHVDKVQYESEEHWHINSEYVYQESNSNFTINTITLNGGTVRNGLNISVDGNNCETNLNGLYLLKGNQHVDNHTKVDHKQPHCTSSELYKGMIDDQATGVFNGKVFVREDAQKIEAFQQNSNILLSQNASMNAKPELEIYADDVKCSHGSTTGQFDDEALFYLKSRGISEKNAHALMAAGFAEDVLVNVTNEFVKLHINELLKERFDWEF